MKAFLMSRMPFLDRRNLLIGGSAALAVMLPASAWSAAPFRRARYLVILESLKPLRFSIDATLPIDGSRISASRTYPAELPQMAGSGWPALIKNLAVYDSSGTAVPARSVGSSGWELSRKIVGHIRLRYSIDFSIFQAAGWSSPRESAFVDAQNVVVACRALFLTTDQTDGALVRFQGPRHWHAIAPWPAISRRNFSASSRIDLTENLLVFSNRRPDIVSAAGFTISITSMGHWQPLRMQLRNALGGILNSQIGMMGLGRGEAYSVVLLPIEDTGGEAYRQSFAYSFQKPTDQNLNIWANTLAHELFHYWNGFRLSGQDYAATQWFQEGFTEYVANRSLVVARIESPDWFRTKLAGHVSNYRRLETTLEAIGTRKGPPLYSAGALVALAFDASIRSATAGKQSLSSFFRNLWRITDSGRSNYSWEHLEAALNATAPQPWNDFYMRHIRGNQQLPLDEILQRVGMQLIDGNVVVDQNSEPATRAILAAMNARL